MGEGFVAVLGEVDIAAEGHPVAFDGCVGDRLRGDGGRSANGDGVGVGAFEVEGEAALRVDEEGIAAHLNLVEFTPFAGIYGAEEAVVGAGDDLADVVVLEAFGIVADAVWEALLVAVGDLRRDGDGEFGLGGADSVVEGSEGAGAGIVGGAERLAELLGCG